LLLTFTIFTLAPYHASYLSQRGNHTIVAPTVNNLPLLSVQGVREFRFTLPRTPHTCGHFGLALRIIVV
jgi:hypothetical protein